MKELQNLVRLDISRNKIKSMALFTMEEQFPNLKWLNVAANKFNEFPAIKVPKLEYLDISFNKLDKINDQWTGHPNLRVLKAVDNKFKNFNLIKNMPALVECYLANNQISIFAGWESLPLLKKLHLRKNKIEKVQGGEEAENLPELPVLEYLNLRSNKIASME